MMMSYAQITSPIDGIVTDRRIEVGDLANPGQVLLTVYDSEHMRLEAPVPVRLVDRLALEPGRRGQAGPAGTKPSRAACPRSSARSTR